MQKGAGGAGRGGSGGGDGGRGAQAGAGKGKGAAGGGGKIPDAKGKGKAEEKEIGVGPQTDADIIAIEDALYPADWDHSVVFTNAVRPLLLAPVSCALATGFHPLAALPFAAPRAAPLSHIGRRAFARGA